MCTYVVIIQNSKSKRAKIAKKSIKCITLNLEKLRLHTPHYYFQYKANILSSKGPTFLGKWTSTNSVLNTKKVSLNSSSGWRVFKRGFVQVKTLLLSTFLNELKYTNMHFNNDYRSLNFSPSYMLILWGLTKYWACISSWNTMVVHLLRQFSTNMVKPPWGYFRLCHLWLYVSDHRYHWFFREIYTKETRSCPNAFRRNNTNM